MDEETMEFAGERCKEYIDSGTNLMYAVLAEDVNSSMKGYLKREINKLDDNLKTSVDAKLGDLKESMEDD